MLSEPARLAVLKKDPRLHEPAELSICRICANKKILCALATSGGTRKYHYEKVHANEKEMASEEEVWNLIFGAPDNPPSVFIQQEPDQEQGEQEEEEEDESADESEFYKERADAHSRVSEAYRKVARIEKQLDAAKEELKKALQGM
jgi:hypothetical protein